MRDRRAIMSCWEKIWRMSPEIPNVNHVLVKADMAWWFRKYAPNDTTLEKLENEAREMKRGLWAELNPVAPWVTHPHGQLPRLSANTVARQSPLRSLGYFRPHREIRPCDKDLHEFRTLQ